MKKNWKLLISAIAVMCLFFKPTIISSMIIGAVLVIILVMCLFDIVKVPLIANHLLQGINAVLAILIMVIGYNDFKGIWILSRKVNLLAETLNVSVSFLVLFIYIIGCIIGFYAIYALSCYVMMGICKLLFKAQALNQDQAIICANLKKNWYFPVSAVAFFSLYFTPITEVKISLLIAMGASIVISSQIPSILDIVKKSDIRIQIVSMLTALGVCWSEQETFCINASIFFKIMAMFVGILAVFCVFFAIVIFWKKMIKIFKEVLFFNNVKIVEVIIYGALFVALLSLMIISFSQTDAFYGTEFDYDIVYTSDSPLLVKDNVYLMLTHPENDLRQPLFAVFASPFIGIPYLLGKLLGATAPVTAMLINSIQILILLISNFMLARIMKFNSTRRICFMILTSCIYPQLLFTL